MTVRTHSPMQCDGHPCVVHNPSDHHMNEWPIVYRIDRAVEMPAITIEGSTATAVVRGPVFVLAERTCPHGCGHPDPDSLAFARRNGGEEFASTESVHGCDGCCRDPKKPITAEETEALKKFVESQPYDADGDKDLEELLAGPWRFLPDDHPHTVELRKKFNEALDDIDARGPQVVVTAPPPGWLGPIRVAHPHTVTWRSVTDRAAIIWDEPLWLALKPRQKMDGDYYPVEIGYFDGDSFIECNGTHLDDEVTHWAEIEYPPHPTKPVR